ncbi:hypothetical protein RchiOBHm_Chr2g0142331 [Rosa chinensis]|uniref:Uncharacterized protein n=1 Tax=Rosa chinensis TaxID=74649 RepID=A0A2P6RXV7_ROSCH|nr:hypothetical protein RchiOBHm_Chr2g0142331 [Rosa chinensis]
MRSLRRGSVCFGGLDDRKVNLLIYLFVVFLSVFNCRITALEVFVFWFFVIPLMNDDI